MWWVVLFHPEVLPQHWAISKSNQSRTEILNTTSQHRSFLFTDCLMYLLTWPKSVWHSGAASHEGPLAASSWRRGSPDKKDSMAEGETADCGVADFLFYNHLLLERLCYSLSRPTPYYETIDSWLLCRVTDQAPLTIKVSPSFNHYTGNPVSSKQPSERMPFYPIRSNIGR